MLSWCCYDDDAHAADMLTLLKYTLASTSSPTVNMWCTGTMSTVAYTAAVGVSSMSVATS